MKPELSNGQSHFWQWDTKQKIKVDGEAKELHYIGIDGAVEVDGDGWAAVPDELLQNSGTLLGWAYLTDHTIERFAVGVSPRAKPPDYVYTPTEVKTWTELEQKIRELEKKSQSGTVRTILPYTGYILAETTAEDAAAPASGNLANLYGKWDALAAKYPHNVSMEVLGTDGSGAAQVTYNMTAVEWEVGTIKNTGINLANNYRIRTVGAIYLPAGARISCGGKYAMSIAEYDSYTWNDNFALRSKSEFGAESYTTSAAGYVRISMYDAINNPKYTDNQDLIDGTSGSVSIVYEDTTSGGYEIRCYTITSNSDRYKWVDSHDLTPPPNLKILWISGVHGHESTIFVDDLKFFTDLLEQDCEVTARLMDNCTFKVLPAACPWGYDHGSRTNKNGVNINRNFSAGWEFSGEATNNYSGERAESETETQLIAQFLENNRDCYMAVNRHSSSEFSPTSVLGFLVSQFKQDQAIAFNSAKYMSGQIKRSDLYGYIIDAENSDADERCLHTVETSTATGTLDKYFNSLGIHGYLYEASSTNKVGDGYYADDWGREIWQRINVSNIGNLLYSLMLQNKEET